MGDRASKRFRPGTDGLEIRLVPASFLVTTTASDGPGSLRKAILSANELGGPDTISFSIPGQGLQLISATSGLPAITDPLTIDGYTQPGSRPNGVVGGFDGAVRVVVVGGGSTEQGTGFDVVTGQTMIRGLAIVGFKVGVRFTAGVGNSVVGNTIGVAVSGGGFLQGNGIGVLVQGTTGVSIGGDVAGDANIIAGNDQGVVLRNANSIPVRGNIIGSVGNSVVGLVGNGVGVLIEGGQGDLIEKNVIAANNGHGVIIDGSSAPATGHRVWGNLIGTDHSGTQALGNQGEGVYLRGEARANLIGGALVGQGNIIIDNLSGGVRIEGDLAAGNSIQGNSIGVDGGSSPRGNGLRGVTLAGNASNNLIGGTNLAEANTIAFNQGPGVIVQSGVGNAILGNRIYDNFGLGIDLRGDGPSANPDGDPPTGPNRMRKYPVLTQAFTSQTNLLIRGGLDLLNGATARVEFYASPQSDPSGYGEGRQFLGARTVVGNASGSAVLDLTLPAQIPVGWVVTATATSSTNDTSEFSPVLTVQPLPSTDLSVSVTNLTGTLDVGQDAEYEIVVRDLGPFLATGVIVDVALPANAQLVQATSDQGSFVTIAGGVRFQLGTLDVGASIKARLKATLTIPGNNTLTATALSDRVDLNPADNQASVSIAVRDRPGRLGFATEKVTVDERAGVVVVAVTRTLGTLGKVSVNFATLDGTAKSGSDFQAQSGVLSFANGETSKTIQVPIVTDALAEGRETFQLVLSGPGGGASLVEPSATTVEIQDTPGKISFASATFAAREGEDALIVVQRIGGAGGSLVVNLTALGGTATPGLDLELVDRQLVFADGQSSAMVIRIPLMLDPILEGNETLNLALGQPSDPGIIGALAQARLTIEEPVGAFRFETSILRLDPGGDRVDLTIRRIDGAGGEASVLARTIDGTALSGRDYQPVESLVTFANGESIKTLSIEISPNRAGPKLKTFQVQLESPTSGALLGAPALTSVVLEHPIAPVSDFDGDGRGDVSVFRPSSAQWFILGSSGGPASRLFGAANLDQPISADYDGDGQADLAVYRPSTAQWFILQSRDGPKVVAFGAPKLDVPVPMDYDGDGKTDIAVYRASTAQWFILRSHDGPIALGFGAANLDQPVPADYDGDGKADIAVFRPTTAQWFVLGSQAGPSLTAFGGVNLDRPVPADYDGDGKADLAVYRPSTAQWLILQSNDGPRVQTFGAVNLDVPVPDDYDGDGKVDLGVFRPSTAQWFLARSSAGPTVQLFGATKTDVPANLPFSYRPKAGQSPTVNFDQVPPTPPPTPKPRPRAGKK